MVDSVSMKPAGHTRQAAPRTAGTMNIEPKVLNIFFLDREEVAF